MSKSQINYSYKMIIFLEFAGPVRTKFRKIHSRVGLIQLQMSSSQQLTDSVIHLEWVTELVWSDSKRAKIGGNMTIDGRFDWIR